MTTKEQEIKALNKIKALVAELGEDSYIATAFEGCFEVAEDNIENDFACSMKQRAESAAKEREEWHQKAMSFEIKWKEDEQKVSDLYDELRNLQEKHEDENTGKVIELYNQTADLQKQLNEKDLEIIKLKARLFDMMNA